MKPLAVLTAPEDHIEAGLEELPAVSSPAVLAQFLGVTTDCLSQWRHYGKGPEFYKLEGHVRYNRSAVAAYLRANRYSRTDKKVGVA